MKKVISLTVVLATTLALGGCYSPQDRAVAAPRSAARPAP